MIFVHLAPRAAVGRIRRNGLRVGNGRRGKGVYAVPLFRIRRVRAKEPQDFDRTDFDFSNPSTSATLWRRLFSAASNRGNRPVAVVFEPPTQCWPLDVFLEVSPSIATPLLRRLQARRGGLEISEHAIAFVLAAAAEGCLSDLEARVHHSEALGRLLREFLAAGGCASSHFSEEVEVVIRRPVPPKAIRRLVPLSLTSAKAQTRRNRDRARRDSGDDIDHS
jgi:hypothetical protein